MAFNIGRMRPDPRIALNLGPQGLEPYIRRHVEGDFGCVSEETKNNQIKYLANLSPAPPFRFSIVSQYQIFACSCSEEIELITLETVFSSDEPRYTLATWS